MPTTIILQGQTLELHPWRAAYWQEARALLLADLHLGKAAHFRQAGIAASAGAEAANQERLMGLLLEYQPQRVLMLGDLFHSHYNHAWEEFADLVARFPNVSFELAPGNHDILAPEHYAAAGVWVRPLRWTEGPFLLTHHPSADGQDGYNLAGHVHPAARLRGLGRQQLRLPCFYFGVAGGILPAFGHFTGLADVPIQPGDRVYVVAGNEVLEVGG